jgi:hypothetical protein
MHPAEGAHKIAYSRPHPFGGIDMDLPDAIAIIIPCPFVLSMLDGDTLALNSIVALPLIGIRNRLRLGESSHVPLQGLAISVFDDA